MGDRSLGKALGALKQFHLDHPVTATRLMFLGGFIVVVALGAGIGCIRGGREGIEVGAVLGFLAATGALGIYSFAVVFTT